MKKIALLSLLSLLIVNKIFSWEISGPTNVCANTACTYEYTFNGFPEGALNPFFETPTTTGGINCGINGNKFKMSWSSDCSPASTSIEIRSVTWQEKIENEIVYKSFVGPIKLTVNVARLGTIANPWWWNINPYACNTSPIIYNIAPVCGASYYTWSIPPGWAPDPSTPLSGANATSVKLYPTAASGGTISVNAINTNNGCNFSRVYSANITRPVEPPVFTTTKTNYCLASSPTAQFCVNAVPNAASYSWTYPSGWTGPATTTTPCVTVNFNGQVKAGNICCQTNGNCGGVSSMTCFAVTTFNNLPAPASYIPSYTIYSTPYPNRKQVSLSFNPPTPTPGVVYTWYVYSQGPPPYGTGVTYSGNTSSPCVFFMNNGDYFIAHTTIENGCGKVYSAEWGRKLVNGILEPFELARVVMSSDIITNEDFQIFPNPASSTITVNFEKSENDYRISIFNILGKKVTETIQAQKSIDINVSALQNGIYFLQIESGNSIIRKEKIVITH